MIEIKTATEKELQDFKVPYLRTEKELAAFVHSLLDRKHDYGTCVYAMSLAATAAFNLVAHVLGVTGFQAACADIDILHRTRGLEIGRIQDYSNLLYPQYCDDEHFPMWRMAVDANLSWLQERAKKSLCDESHAAKSVRKHWEWLLSLKPSEKIKQGGVS